MRKSSLARVLMMTAATAVWGSTFVVTKGTLTGMAPAGFLTWRFGIAAVLLALACSDRLRAMTANDVRHCVLLGIFLAAGFLLQTTGLGAVLTFGGATCFALHIAGLICHVAPRRVLLRGTAREWLCALSLAGDHSSTRSATLGAVPPLRENLGKPVRIRR